jgi:hypothetical protein
MDPNIIQTILAVGGGIGVIVSVVISTVAGLKKQPQERMKVESESLGGAVEALNRLADVSEDLRDLCKAQFERQAHASEMQAMMLAFEARLAAATKKPPRTRAASRRKTEV